MKTDFTRIGVYLLLCFCFILKSCSDPSNGVASTAVVLDEFTTGNGFFEYPILSDKVMRVFFHIPPQANTNSEILMVFHGNGRNARDYRQAMISKANQYGFIVITPEFLRTHFPSGDTYNLGNVFIDGDNPSASTLNPESDWTFSIIEPLFDFVKQSLNNTTLKYQLFGHSAGGQFAHRFVMFKPDANYDKIVASAPGWYTTTDLNIRFPYGFMESPLENISLERLFEKKMMVQVGNLDNDPNASGLRRNSNADAQGFNRLDRAEHFFNKASVLASSNNLQFEWELHINEGADHDYILASENAADLIFN